MTGGVSTIVPIAGKQVPLEPNWLNKFVASTNWGAFEAQVSGDLIGRRFTSYLNDQKVNSTFVLGLEASYTVDLESDDYLHRLSLL